MTKFIVEVVLTNKELALIKNSNWINGNSIRQSLMYELEYKLEKKGVIDVGLKHIYLTEVGSQILTQITKNNMNNIKWATFCGVNEAVSMRQHCFKEITVKNPYGEEHYLGNKSLCGKISAYEDSILPLSEIEAEKKVDWCCKICDKIYEKGIKI